MLPAVLVESRLGIKPFDVAGAADHEQPDHALGLGGEVRLAVGRRPRMPVHSAHNAVALEHRAQGQARKSHAAVGQEGASPDVAASFMHSLIPLHCSLQLTHRSANRYKLIVVE